MSVARERIVTFGPGQCLIGILCEPPQGAAAPGAPAVLLATVGTNHRVGPNRLWVELSRELAAAGIPALRFDLSGMGDSEPRPGSENELERGRLDMTDAMDALISRGVATRFVLVALCSGVDAAHVVTRDDPRVAAAVFIDGYAHRTSGWYLRHHTLRYFEQRRWRLYFERLARRLRHGPPSKAPQALYTRQYPDVATLERDFAVMVDRHLRLLFVFTGGTDRHYNYAAQFHAMFRRDFRPHVDVDYLRRADHVFFNGVERERLLGRLVAWIAAATLAPAPTAVSAAPTVIRAPTAQRRWLHVVSLAAGILVLLPLGRAASIFANEYASFRASNHVVARPPAIEALPALSDLTINVPGRPALAAWFLPSRNGAAVLLVHGSGGDRANLWPEAQVLAAAGFGVLLVDLPGHGESRGRVDWGAGGRAALAAAVTSLQAQPGVDPRRIGAIGFSMGAMLVAQVAASDERIRAVLLAGGFSDARRQTQFEYRRWGPLAAWPAIWAYRAAGFDDRDQRPIDVIGRLAPRALLVVHGAEDGVVPPAMAGELYAAAGEPRELWLVPGAGHGGYFRAAPELWPRRLREFFLKALPPMHPLIGESAHDDAHPDRYRDFRPLESPGAHAPVV